MIAPPPHSNARFSSPWLPASVVAILLFLLTGTIAVQAARTAVLLRAEVEANPPRITLHWEPCPAPVESRGYSIWRKSRDSNSWGRAGFGGFIAPYASSTDRTAQSWTDPDPNLEVGVTYEYRVHRHRSPGPNSVGFICTGIELPPVHERGRIVLVVDRTFTQTLADELARLQDDLAGDGWTVTRIDFDRGLPLTDPGYRQQVPNLRSAIQDVYRASPDELRAVLLIGHLPVPYTGQRAYDWHDPYNDGQRSMPWHIGAWPADVYYGEMNWEWTDERVNETRSDFSRNHNVPGDGKFDPSSYDEGLPGYPPQGSYPAPELWVGRVDLYNLPAFEQNEEQLLRRYLDQNHAYRHRHRIYERRGLIDYNLREAARGLYENNGPHRSFSALFGPDQVHSNPAVDWFTTLATNTYLWAAGAGYSGFTSIGGIGTTDDFASKPAQVVFTSLYGSYFGDWDSRNNILRAAIANQDILTSVWLGPAINANFGLAVHHMALGETIGYAIDTTHYRGRIYHQTGMWMNRGMVRGLQISLMGDPTLRLHTVAPATNVTFLPPANDNNGFITWTHSPESDNPAFNGYHLYAADNRHGPYLLLNPDQPITDTRFELPADPKPFHMVRTTKLEQTPSGSYHNLSQGIIVQTRP